MELDKLKKWLDLAQQYQGESFWKQIFDGTNTNPSPTPLTNAFSKAQEYSPKCDIYEAEGRLCVEIEIPGLTKEDVEISINQQVLTIFGECKSLKSNRKYFLKERANLRFKKELTLPVPVLHNESRSELSNGVLLIDLPLNREEIEDIPIIFDERPLE